MTATLVMALVSPVRRWWWGALVALCLALFLPGFFTLPPFDRDEARFAQASRQMVESGDYINIRFQDEARLKKPPGIYWMQAAGAHIFGHTAIWPYRVPSLLGAVGAVLATAWVGGRLFGSTIGFAAAAMLAGCVVLGVEARMAKTDAVLLATVVVAQGALARVWLDRALAEPVGWERWRWPLVFWFALAVGVLVKGPVGPMVSAITVAGLCASERRLDGVRRLKPWLGLAVMVTVALPPLVVIAVETHGRFLAESVGHDLVGKMIAGQESKGMPPGYFLSTFWLTLSPFALPAALAAPWAWAHRHRPAVLFCLMWLVPTWLVFEAVPTKLLHYTLPTYPAIALLIAAAAEDHFGRNMDRPRRGLFVAASVFGGVAVLALAVGSAILPWLVDRQIPLVAPLLVLLVSLTAFGAAGWLLWRYHERAALVVSLAGAVLWSVATFGLVVPRVEGLWLSRQMAEAVAALRPCPETTVVTADYSEPSLIFLVGVATRIGGGNDAADHLRQNPACGMVLVQQQAEPLFRRWLNGLPVKALATFHGFNYARGTRQNLTLYVAEP